jgi:predicted acyl esterase
MRCVCRISALASIAACALISVGRASNLPPDQYKTWSTEEEIFVPMRDGVRLSTDVALPKGATGKLPTILVRTPYDRDRLETLKLYELYLKQGYAVVLQNERGRFFSEGYYKNYLHGASSDGYDTLDWIVKQPWSNGKVGTIGCSSSAEQQWPMAAANHPAHAAMVPNASGTAIGDIPGNATRGAFYRGGVPWIGMWAWWYHHLAGARPTP